MLTELREDLLSRLDDPNHCFVFPSEVAAHSWLQEALRLSGRRALPSQRFISWDAFKDRAFPGDPTLRPSTKLTRMVFARQLLVSNRERPFLNAIIPRRQAKGSLNFGRFVAQALPSLHSLAKGLGQNTQPSPLVREWLDIGKAYADFLAGNGLYEAAWLERFAERLHQEYSLYFPDLTDDWHEYRPAIEGIGQLRCLLYSQYAHSNERLPARRYPNSLSEIRSVLLQIRQAVAEGTHPADILVSVGDAEAILPILRREAAIAGVPLDIREARPLAESAGGRLLRDLLDCAGSNFSFASLRRLLLDRSRSFLDQDAARGLIRLGIDKHVIADIPDLGQDIWVASMDGHTPASVRRLYASIKTYAQKLSRATSLDRVRELYDGFRRDCLDESAWTGLQNDQIARCLLELDELAALAGDLGLGEVDQAAELWYQQLEGSLYLATTKGGGVPVYRYRVCAASQPALHFVINLTDQACRIDGRSWRFLREDERARLPGEDSDLSDGVLRLLAASGRQVRLSWSEEGPSGARPPQALLDLSGGGDLLQAEYLAWLPNHDKAELIDGSPDSVFPLQKACAEQARLSSGGQPGINLSTPHPDKPAILPTDLCDSLLTGRSREGLLRISSSLAESYRGCAFRCFLQRFLGISADQTGLSFLDPLTIGSIYHDCLQRIFSPLAAAGRRIVAAEAAGEASAPDKAALRPALEAAIDSYAAESGPFAAILLRSGAPLLLGRLERSLEQIRELMDNCVPWLSDDTSLELALPEEGILLNGIPDLVCVEPDMPGADRRVRLMDFKKNKLPAKEEIQLDEAGRLVRLQIPVYILLLKEQGVTVASAHYLSLEGEEKKASMHAYGQDSKAMLHAEDWPAIRAAVLAGCQEAADGLRQGAVFVPRVEDQADYCSYCDYKPVCRQRFNVR